MSSLSRILSCAMVAVTLTSLSACRSDLADNLTVVCPSRVHYVNYVSEVTEKRCGMLDCHGSDFRPMRLLGKFGLREPGQQTGKADSTDFEKSSNYFGVCSIEPEKVARVVADPGGNAVNTLLLVRKGRGQEGHKGGKVFEPWDDSDRCVVGWLRGDPEVAVRDACKAALAKLP